MWLRKLRGSLESIRGGVSLICISPVQKRSLMVEGAHLPLIRPVTPHGEQPRSQAEGRAGHWLLPRPQGDKASCFVGGGLKAGKGKRDTPASETSL